MDQVEERIGLFNLVRDIPYHIGLYNEQDYCCGTKANLLSRLLNNSSRLRVCEFEWENLGLPNEILELWHQSPELHIYLEVKIDDYYVTVDPTWDSKLIKVFNIEYWDGLSSTGIAVPADKFYNYDEGIKKLNGGLFIPVGIDFKFVRELNTYLKQVRDVKI